ncbi:MAG: ATP-sensitive inward rectifier potassium channel 10 [Myxococcales bacterium]|nr:ATP-sensitive inward rectifier potassium channel 10 [Myxococcales bacterium]
MTRPPIIQKTPGADYAIHVIGARATPLRDFYHALLRRSWWATAAVLAGAFLFANAMFALLYLWTGGVANAAPGSFADVFFFSVQTMGTIGYGGMAPVSTAANLIVVLESLTGLMFTALATGLMFAKFSRSTARIMFSRQVTIAPMNGVPTLAFRLGNERGNLIVDARIRVVLSRTEQIREGGQFYRLLDLELLRDRSLSLARSWTVLHQIDAKSPLFGTTAEAFAAAESEIQVMLVGIDDITMQTVHASYQYFVGDVLFGARHVDVLREVSPTVLELDLRRFHDTEPSTPTPDFPYPR